jgi:cytochrome b pre-mRNA-processing protein 3
MRKLGEAFYGRVKSYDEALETLPDRAALTAVIGRTFSPQGGDVAALADYAVRAEAALVGQPLDVFLNGEVAWANI